MKTTRIISLSAAALSLVFAATASAVPASKRIGSAKIDSGSCITGSHSHSHDKLVRVGPVGKGYIFKR